MNIRVNIVKVKYTFQDNEVYGVELRFAPKVKKFLSLNKDTKELLDLVGNGLSVWYDRADWGDDITLSLSLPDNPREKVVAGNTVQSESKKITVSDPSDFWKD